MAQNNRLRIVGGRHRGRILRFPDVRGLRPTASRMRETLFNWLQRDISGSRCMDLFSGSGALGLEALSRGAEWVQFVDRSAAVVAQLQRHIQQLDEGAHARVNRSDSLKWLRQRPEKPFDIVFLDPPFADDLLQCSCDLLQQRGWLNTRRAWIYLEQDGKSPWPQLPREWMLHRQAQAGQAASRLYKICYDN